MIIKKTGEGKIANIIKASELTDEQKKAISENISKEKVSLESSDDSRESKKLEN